MDIPADKFALRRTLRRARQQLGRDERRRATRRIQRHLFRHIKRGARIGVYWPIRSELRRGDFIHTALQLSLIHISAPTRQDSLSYTGFCLKKQSC